MRWWFKKNGAAPAAPIPAAMCVQQVCILSKNRAGHTWLHYDGVCLSISCMHNAYKSRAYSIDQVTMDRAEIELLRRFLDGDLSIMQHLPG